MFYRLVPLCLKLFITGKLGVVLWQIFIEKPTWLLQNGKKEKEKNGESKTRFDGCSNTFGVGGKKHTIWINRNKVSHGMEAKYRR